MVTVGCPKTGHHVALVNFNGFAGSLNIINLPGGQAQIVRCIQK
jgi:hypothetical protein